MARTAVTLSVGGNFAQFNAGLQQAVTNAQRSFNSIKFNNPLGTISRDVKDFDRSLQAASQRVITFSASLGTLAASAQILKTIVKDTLEVEKAFVDINSVFQLSSASLQKFSRDLFDVARETSQSFDVAAEAAKEFSRQGLDSVETLKRVRDAMILTRASGLDVSKSIETLTATINGFNSASVDSTRIINKLVAVDQNFAVSARDLAEALSRVGATAQDAGVSFDQLIGLVTAAQQTTARGGSVIGNSLKTIFTRLGRSDTLQQLEDLNISVRDLQGNAKPALEIMSNLAKEFDGLSEAAKSQSAELVGGVFQINVLRSVLKDLGKDQSLVTQATNLSSTAFDEAKKRNEALNKSLDSLLVKTQLTTKQIASTIGQVTFSDKLKDALDVLNNNPIAESLKNINTNDSGVKYGENLGSDIAEGILAGIGNVITGPGLIYISKALGKVASSTFRIFGGDLAQIIGIGGEQNKQATTLRQINDLYAAGTTQLNLQLETARALSSTLRGMSANGAPGPAGLEQRLYQNAVGGAATFPYRNQRTIRDTISLSRRPSLDTSYNNLVTGQISGEGQNLEEAMNYARQELLRAGVSARDINSAMRRNITALDNYETTLRTNQEVARRATLLNQALSSRRPLDPRSPQYQAVSSQAELMAEQAFRTSVGKGATDELTRAERAQLAEQQRMAVNAAHASINERIAQQRASRIQRIGFGLSFAAPLVAGLIPEGAGGTRPGQALSATSNALEGAGLGFAIGGPKAALAGGILGAAKGFIDKIDKSFEELAKEIEDSNAKSVTLINNAAKFLQLSETIRNGAAAGLSERDIKTLISQQRGVVSAFSNINDRRAFLSASGNPIEEERIVADIQKRESLRRSSDDITSAVGSANNNRGRLGRLFNTGFDPKDVVSISEAIRVAIERRREDNPSILQGLASASTQEKFKILGLDEKAISEFKVTEATLLNAFSIAISGLVDFGDEASKAKLKQANLTKELNTTFDFLSFENKILKSNFSRQSQVSSAANSSLISIGGFSAETEANLRLQQRLVDVENAGIEEFRSAFEDEKKRINTSTKGAASLDFSQGLLNAKTLSDLAGLEGLASNNEVKSTLRDSLFNLKLISLNTKNELQKTNELAVIARAQNLSERRSGALSSGRFSESLSEELQNTLFRANSGLGPRSEAQRANALGQISDRLDQLGVGKTDNTKTIRETLDIISTSASYAQIITEITGRYVNANSADIIRAIDDYLARNRGTNLDDRATEDNLTRIKNNTKLLSDVSSRKTILPFAENPQYGAVASQSDVSKLIDDQKEVFKRGLQERNILQDKINAELAAALKEENDKSKSFTLLSKNKNVSSDGTLQNKIFNSILSSAFEKNYPIKFGPSTGTGGAPTFSDPLSNRDKIRQEILSLVKSGSYSDLQESLSPSGNLSKLALEANVPIEEFKSVIRQVILDAAKTLISPSEYNTPFFPVTPLPKVKSQTQAAPSRFGQGSIFSIGDIRSTLQIPSAFNPIGFSTDISPPKSAIDNLIGSNLGEISRLSSQISDRRQTGDIEKELQLNKQIVALKRQNIYLTELQAGANKKNLYITTQIASQIDDINETYKEIGRGKLTRGSVLESKELELANLRGLGGDSVGSFKGGFQSPFSGMKQELKNFAEVGATVAKSLESNFTDAFANFAIGAQKGKDAFRSFIIGVLQDSSRAFASKAVQGILGSIFGGSGGISTSNIPTGSAYGGVRSKSPALLMAGEVVIPRENAMSIGYETLHKMNSGSIGGYANGGLVRGGSGIRDDVFAMLRPGDFVMKKSAVGRLGADNLLEMTKSARVQKRFFGGAILGALLGGGLGYMSGGKKGAITGALIGGIGGGLYQNYSQTGNAFKGLSNAGMFSFSAGSAAVKSNPVIGSLLGAGVLGVLSGALSPKSSSPDNSPLPSLTLGAAESLRASTEAQEVANISSRGAGPLVPVQTKDGFIVYERGYVPATRRFSGGGTVGGMNMASMASSSYSPPPIRFASGGTVPSIDTGATMSIASPVSSGGVAGGSSGSLWTGNINIVINKDGSVQDNSSATSNQSDGSNLAQRVRSAVLEVLNDEQRTGGTLWNAYGTSMRAR